MDGDTLTPYTGKHVHFNNPINYFLIIFILFIF